MKQKHKIESSIEWTPHIPHCLKSFCLSSPYRKAIALAIDYLLETHLFKTEANRPRGPNPQDR
jgi:hypothetical protein